MPFASPPRTAAWAHQDARVGFEVVHFELDGSGCRAVGCTTAVESGQAWFVDYEIEVDATWTTRRARIRGHSGVAGRAVLVEHDGLGNWRVDGVPAPQLDGCLDVDLESSAMTNTLPVHRLGLAVEDRADAPAAYVRATDLGVDRLEQEYVRVASSSEQQEFDYTAPAFGFSTRLRYAADGLVAVYPGIAVRVA